MKYAPVMWNHARAFGQPLAAAGEDVRYLLTESYQWMVGRNRSDIEFIKSTKKSNPVSDLSSFLRKGGIDQVRQAFAQNRPRLVLFVNFNQLVDRILIREARRANPRVRIIVLIHEPYTEDKLVYGRKRAALLYFYEKLTFGLAQRADAVILPSNNAEQTWKKYSGGIGRDTRMIPLPFVDEAPTSQAKRTHISFVGQIAHAHQKGLDLFLEMVEHAPTVDPELRFRIVTGDETNALLKKLSPRARERLEIITGSPLADATIHEALRSSLVVTILQRRVMQSGTLPVAMMNATPVLVTGLVGLTQFVNDRQNGRIVEFNSTAEERLLVLREMLRDLSNMSLAARRYYEETFDSRNVTPHIPWLLGTREAVEPRPLPIQN
ncbi:glycosyltransferase [Myxococcota bacterium]|nr:glycosyltransferase [Myxococcota bacterium]